MTVVLVLIILRYDYPLTKDKIIGTYINTNFNNQPCCVEAPHEIDTLTLKSDFTYSSNFYGTGMYELNGSNISWTYTYEMGNAGYSSYVTNKLFEEPRIILNYKLNHYYKKIK